MLINSILLAVTTAIGFFIIFTKFPKWLKKFILKHSLLTDFIACMLTYVLLGGTLIALFAAAWMGILVSIILAIANNPVTYEALNNLILKINVLKNQAMSILVKWIEKSNQEAASV